MKNGFVLMLVALFLGFGTAQAQTTCAPKDCKKMADVKKCAIPACKKLCDGKKSTAAIDLSLENIMRGQQTATATEKKATAKAVNVKNTTPTKKATCKATCQKAKKTSTTKVALKQ